MVGILGLFSCREGGEMRADPATPVGDARYVVVDTELTGLDGARDSIVSVGAVRMRGSSILAGETFYTLVGPGAEITKESVVIHGITPSDVAEKPAAGDALREFAAFCGEDVLVGHCLSIDLEFMGRELRRAGGRAIRNPAVDTLAAHAWLLGRAPRYRALFPTAGGTDLGSIATALGIPARGVHNALMDAFITAQVFQRQIPLLAAAGVTGIGELIRLADPSKGGEIQGAAGEICNF